MSDSIELVVSRPEFDGGRRRRCAVIVCIVAAFTLSRVRPTRLRKTMEWFARRSGPPSAAAVVGRRREIEALSVVCAGEGCLPRSIAICLLSFGDDRTWPTWSTGVRLEPFRAHAWVDCGGDPTGESPDFEPSAYLVVASIVAGNCGQ